MALMCEGDLDMDASDDSDFYGDDDEVVQLNKKVNQFDVSIWWCFQAHQQNPARLHLKAQAPKDMSQFHNPYAGVPYAWQLTETVDNFLCRLPPSTTEGYPWIYVCNPYIQRKPKSSSPNQQIVGCEDEGPEDNDADLTSLIQGGMERLHMVSDFADHLRTLGKPLPQIQNEVKKAGLDASQDLLGLAKHLRVTCGKWMLFCTVSDVNTVWEIVAKATVNNELGIAAKVAPKSTTDFRAERIICVYTADFSNTQDVKRVATSLHRLGLIPPMGRPIYYKPDAYTYLGLGSQNPWGIRASIYNSTTVLNKW
ncbi:DUF1917 domain-containing protein [Microdochium nivale]|nr:DUF1917 domain-containing protein [Microdochium nivale]